MPYRAVLFDLDGTLLDSVALIVASFEHALEAHGLPARDRATICAGIGTPLVAQLETLSGGAVPLEPLVETYRTHNIAHHDRMARPFPGVQALVRRLQQTGTRLGLVTSKRRAGADRGLRLLELEGCFDVIVAADDVERGKPHPEPVHRSLEGLGCAPGEAAFVGDSVHDIEAGNRAGVATVGVLWGPFGRQQLEPARPHRLVETVEELARLLETAPHTSE